MNRRYFGLAALCGLMLACCWFAEAQVPAPKKQPPGKDFKDGNFKDAYNELRKKCLDSKADRMQVGKDLQLGVTALQRLGREDETDEFREAVIAVHKDNWRLLNAAAQSYERANHQGFIIAGKFERGGRRGGGKYVSSFTRDRVRALQLMNQALPLTGSEADKAALAQYFVDFARMLLSTGGQHEPWRLQSLSNLTELPDYDEVEGRFGRGVWGNPIQGAPVDADGKPIFHQLPKGYDAAKSDGERWRWLLHRAMELNPTRTSELRLHFANFLMSQFGEQTMAHHGWLPPPQSEEDRAQDTSGTYALHTLGEDETIAKLATGIKRFKLPDEFNYLRIFKQIAPEKSNHGQQAADIVARTYANRRQYVKAAASWREAIKTHGTGSNNVRQQALDQLVNNWGRFENLQPMASGKNATVEFRYRNGTRVAFEAYPIKVSKLLDDVKAYLKSNPARLDGNQMNISEIGHRLVEGNQVQYLDGKPTTWNLDLKPRSGHVDDRVTVTTPLSKAGAYLLIAKMDNGNTSRIIIWLNDTVIAKKPLDGKTFCYVADSVTGRPVEKANVEFFGWRQRNIPANPQRFQIDTINFAEFSDGDGQVILGQDRLPQDHQWLITATTKDGRLAYLGFTGVWHTKHHDIEYNQTKVFMITDRPVYRPAQTVQFKVWIQHAKYDQDNVSAFANQEFPIEVRNPKGDKILEKVLKTDQYGGLAGELALSKDATLGVYHVQISPEKNRRNLYGGTNFRVEEYKKPEFEVKVEAPKEPVALGDTITAKIEANYYFGAPVTNGRVKYKVMRTTHSANWYPHAPWDWFYGKGYWWFAYDAPWYPGWGEWGCVRPMPWWHHAPQQPPEVVMENEVSIGADGTIEVQIDTKPAKELHGRHDHKYTITAEVADESRRTIVGTGDVLVARKPFKVHTWVDRGHYRIGDTVKANFNAHTLDQKPVQGKGELSLFRIRYVQNKPVEDLVQKWELDTNVEGVAQQQVAASEAGQFRLSYKLTDAKKHTIEGGYMFVVRGEGFDGKEFRFNEIEIITDKKEYAPGETVRLMINTNQPGAAVALFVHPANGVYLPPKIVRLMGKSTVEEVAIVKKDMPNFFVEAITVANGKLHTDVREVVVPPEQRVLTVAVEPSAKEYLPGAEAKVRVKLTDTQGRPFVGSTVVTVYDRSVEYISGGSNVPEIKEFFWKWRRQHHQHTESNVQRMFHNLLRSNERGMGNLGIFDESVVEELERHTDGMLMRQRDRTFRTVSSGIGGGPGGMPESAAMAPGAPAMAMDGLANGQKARRAEGDEKAKDKGGTSDQQSGPQPTIRSQFADTAFWTAHVETNKEGIADITFKMPENLTGWKVKCWAMGHGTKVGEGVAEIVTKKNILVRMQAPRFFVERDEVVLSANVHNYLKTDKDVFVQLELPGSTLQAMGNLVQQVQVKSGGDKRVDWRVKVTHEGEAIVRMKAITDEESDAMESKFPVYVHGMLKMESFSGVIRPDKTSGTVKLSVPADRRINDSRLELRFSPTLAGAMVDALPYMVEYPYGCTEQTLNRFLPTVITQNILKGMNLNLKDIRDKRTNLNAQELGDAKDRAKGWKRFDRNPVFDEAEVQQIVKAGVDRLIQMQLGDGGWGWFSGFGERSFPHTTAVVVHGLQIAQKNGVALPPNILKRGIDWLKNHQAQEVQKIKNAPGKIIPWKHHADNLDAFVYMVLIDEDIASNEMLEFLYRDRVELSVYAKSMFGIALHKQRQAEKLAMIHRNIEQFLFQDDENQTAYLRLPANNAWWYWYGSEIEANAWYLKLLSLTHPKEDKTSRLVKYILNNRKHATYWTNTRDTAYAIEALADYMKASGEDKPDLTIEVWLDGKKQKEVKVDASNLFTFDNVFVQFGDAVTTGEHTLELRKKGTGPVYYNAYLTNFTLEDFITKAGLEIKVGRKYYKLTRTDKSEKVAGTRGQAVDQKVEKYVRTELPNLSTLKSGDLVEVELEIDSKNDYEYLLFEDPKASGFESVAVQSGYTRSGMGAYMEVRDDRIAFFVRWLARGKHSISYRLRAEIPGQFSALPARASAMYAPELKGNSDEMKVGIVD